MVQQLKKLISLFYQNYFDKPIVISPAINTALSIVRPTVKPIKFFKQKQD